MMKNILKYTGAGLSPVPILFLILLDCEVRADSTNGSQRLERAIELFHLSRYQQAEPLLDELETEHPQNAAVQFWKAYNAYKLNRLKKARNAIALVVKLDPNSADVTYLDALIAKALNDTIKAKKRFHQVIDLSPGSDLAWSSRKHLNAIA